MGQEAIPKKMKALVLTESKKLVYKDVIIPKIGDNEVLVKVKACGICGSDIDRVENGGVHFLPIIIGHEFSGIVVGTGSLVKNISLGDHVTAAPLIPCNKCENCLNGHPAMCNDYSFIGSRENGAMAEYVSVPAENILKIPENMDFARAACIEPLTVAIHGIERAGLLHSGSTAVVYGCGTIGMFVLQCLKIKGIEKVYVIDIDENKLNLAQKIGAYKVINSSQVDVVKYFCEQGKADYVFETAGVNILQAQILSLVKKNGSVVYVGTAQKDVLIPAKVFELILRGELKITGSWMSYSSPFPGKEWLAAIEYLESGKIVVDDIITHKFSLKAGHKAFETMLDKNQKTLKVMYLINK
ncbi:galactitol-1-phosphate 5-dehydrogenase [Pectinatus frisingensis]|uniref:galactitol-1-phosphate 5-dehydrogenase n=1 Tax=Pectinatus frisingensis TaxID=865 RepID=UPI001E2E7710|nr:galactitol-1-phosphate 5-dehydrogenase [Pectinatus frisingensis]